MYSQVGYIEIFIIMLPITHAKHDDKIFTFDITTIQSVEYIVYIRDSEGKYCKQLFIQVKNSIAQQ